MPELPADDLLSSYQFTLPPELIAQTPAPRRDESRLMVLGTGGGTAETTFRCLPDYLRPGDLLVRNNVRVIPARLLGTRAGGGAAEALLVRREKTFNEAIADVGHTAVTACESRSDAACRGERWLCLARPANRFKKGRIIAFGPNGELAATVRERGPEGMVWLEFPLAGAAFMEALERYGQIPLPPYITRPGKTPTPEDALRYQTHFAETPGAVAAPTAGLHFTPELDKRLADKGIGIAEITLNVGPGTFRPIKAGNLAEHRMHEEWYRIPSETLARIVEVKEGGGKIIAVGTTVARTLEAGAASGSLSGWTDIFIRPGFCFRMVDGLITNFHLPGSSLLVLVSALVGREILLNAYERAVAGGWRFYSYGDAMLIYPGAIR